jgi:hypothetical protein
MVVAGARGDGEGHKFEVKLGYIVRPCLKTISWRSNDKMCCWVRCRDERKQKTSNLDLEQRRSMKHFSILRAQKDLCTRALSTFLCCLCRCLCRLLASQEYRRMKGRRKVQGGSTKVSQVK